MLGFGRKRRRSINLALQGGGAHGAFTWGVLDRLLEEPDLDLAWISATSAGAVNAVALASGLATGGNSGARTTLRTVWEAVQEAGVPDLLRLNPFLAGLSRPSSLAPMASILSPYDFNPLGFDPLRRLLTEHIDFAAIRKSPGGELLIATTDVATGRKHLFRRERMTVEAVLASACLPTIHHAVEIDGRAFWDGGFSANPDLVSLAAESPVGDTLLIVLSSMRHENPPRSAREIAEGVSRMTFDQPLIRDIEAIAAARQSRPSIWRRPIGTSARLAAHRFHLIEAGRHTRSLSSDTKMRPERAIIERLFEGGRLESETWLERNRAMIGRRETADLPAWLDRPARAEPARTPEADAPARDSQEPATSGAPPPDR